MAHFPRLQRLFPGKRGRHEEVEEGSVSFASISRMKSFATAGRREVDSIGEHCSAWSARRPLLRSSVLFLFFSAGNFGQSRTVSGIYPREKSAFTGEIHIKRRAPCCRVSRPMHSKSLDTWRRPGCTKNRCIIPASGRGGTEGR